MKEQITEEALADIHLLAKMIKTSKNPIFSLVQVLVLRVEYLHFEEMRKMPFGKIQRKKRRYSNTAKIQQKSEPITISTMIL